MHTEEHRKAGGRKAIIKYVIWKIISNEIKNTLNQKIIVSWITCLVEGEAQVTRVCTESKPDRLGKVKIANSLWCEMVGTSIINRLTVILRLYEVSCL